MSMQFATPGAASKDPEPMMEMNMTPLIDVMLVLIIMLIITIPKQNQSINLNLPAVTDKTPPAPPAIITLEVEFDDTLKWNGVPVPDRATLEANLATMAAAKVPGELHVRADKFASYKAVAAVMSSAKRKGIVNMGLVGNEQFL